MQGMSLLLYRVHCSKVDPPSACSSSEASVASGCWWVAILVGPALPIIETKAQSPTRQAEVQVLTDPHSSLPTPRENPAEAVSTCGHCRQ